MAARGAEEKESVKQKILEVFEGSFLNDKEIRIPINGLEIKVTLTAAKDVVGGGATPVVAGTSQTSGFPQPVTRTDADIKITEEEKAEVQALLSKFNL